MRRTIGTAAALGLLLLTLGASAAQAQPTATTQMSTLDATKGACSNGMATWTVHPKVTVTNDSDGLDEVSKVFYTAKYTVNGSQATTDAQATDTGGLAPGATIPAGASADYYPTVTVSIACDASAATLFVNYDLVNGHKTFVGGTQFLSGGTSVPTGAVGALGVVGVVGLVALTRRRKPAVTAPADSTQLTVTG